MGSHHAPAPPRARRGTGRPGAGSVIGTDAVAKNAPDGYTLLRMSNAHTVNESLIPNTPFQLLRDFVPIAPINASDLVRSAATWT